VQERLNIYVKAVPNCLPLFCCCIRFSIGNLDKTVSISIRGITSTTKLISRFPTTVKKLIEAQELENLFRSINYYKVEKTLLLTLAKRYSRPFSYIRQLGAKRPFSRNYI
jgi:hypothetical protein